MNALLAEIPADVLKKKNQTFQRIVYWGLCAYVAATFIISFFPRYWNWGLNALGFFPLVVKVSWLLLALCFLIPAIRNTLFEKYQQILSSFKRINTAILFLSLFVALAFLCWMLPVQFFHLGDGSLMLTYLQETAAKIKAGEEVSFSLTGVERGARIRQPLALFIERVLFFSLDVPSTGDILTTYRIEGIIALGLTLLALFYFWKKTPFPPAESSLLSCFLFSTTSAIFFFGYVELYSFLFASVVAFLVFSWLVREEKSYFIFVGIIFVLLFGFHFAGGLFLFSLAALTFFSIQKRKTETVLSSVSAIILALFMFALLKFPFKEFLEQFQHGGGKFFLPLFTASAPTDAYVLFSVHHLRDIINVYFLAQPTAGIVFVSFFLIFGKHIHVNHPTFLILILATLSGILFVFTGNFELGLFRDWDIASVYLFPLTFFCVFIFKQDFFHTEKNGTFSRLLFSLAGISLLHCGTWIALNNNEAKSMERFLTIQNDTEMSPTVRGYYQDQVGQFYLRKNDYQTAAHHFEIARRDISQHISLASRLKQCYLHTGEKEKLGVLLLRVVELDTMIPNNWLSLGQFYYDNENYAEAQRIFLKTLTLDSLNEQALFNLARLNFLQLNNSDEAIFSLKKILSVNSSHLDAMRAIIPPLLAKELFEEAEQYALQYLEYEPNDTLMTALLPDIQRARQEQSTSTNRNEIPRR